MSYSPWIGMCQGAFPDTRNILELGPLDGRHTVPLAQWTQGEVLAIEGRMSNANRTYDVIRACGVEAKATVRKGDLETLDLSAVAFEFEVEFDLVFCCGVLYHMADPIRLLDQMAKVAPHLFMWTHHGGAEDKPYGEYGMGDPLSGLYPTSLWLSEQRLMAELDARYDSVVVHAREDTISGPAITISAARGGRDGGIG